MPDLRAELLGVVVDGTYRGDRGNIIDEIPPFTTIASRMSHLIDCYGSRRLPTPRDRGVLGFGVAPVEPSF